MHPKSSLYKRIIQTASPGACQRFLESMDLFFQTVQLEAIDRINGTTPDVSSYIPIRRGTVGGEVTCALIEYAYHLHIPDDVIEHPTIRSLVQAMIDFSSFSNVSPFVISDPIF